MKIILILALLSSTAVAFDVDESTFVDPKAPSKHCVLSENHGIDFRFRLVSTTSGFSGKRSHYIALHDSNHIFKDNGVYEQPHRGQAYCYEAKKFVTTSPFDLAELDFHIDVRRGLDCKIWDLNDDTSASFNNSTQQYTVKRNFFDTHCNTH